MQRFAIACCSNGNPTTPQHLSYPSFSKTFRSSTISCRDLVFWIVKICSPLYPLLQSALLHFFITTLRHISEHSSSELCDLLNRKCSLTITVDLKTGLPSNARQKILESKSGDSIACAWPNQDKTTRYQARIITYQWKSHAFHLRYVTSAIKDHCAANSKSSMMNESALVAAPSLSFSSAPWIRLPHSEYFF